MRKMEKALIRRRIQQIRLILGASCFIRDERFGSRTRATRGNFDF
jgi:hypothetical protein